MLGNPRGFPRVHIFRRGYLRTFSRIAGCVAAYAFVLNLLLVALSGALNAGNASYDASWQELCQQSADGTAPASTHHAAKFHCLLCTAGSQLATVAPDVVVAAIVPVAASVLPVVCPDTGDDIPLSVAYLSKPPRGPPQQA